MPESPQDWRPPRVTECPHSYEARSVGLPACCDGTTSESLRGSQCHHDAPAQCTQRSREWRWRAPLSAGAPHESHRHGERDEPPSPQSADEETEAQISGHVPRLTQLPSDASEIRTQVTWARKPPLCPCAPSPPPTHLRGICLLLLIFPALRFSVLSHFSWKIPKLSPFFDTLSSSKTAIASLVSFPKYLFTALHGQELDPVERETRVIKVLVLP